MYVPDDGWGEPVGAAAAELNSEGNSKLSFNAGDDLSRTRYLQNQPKVSHHTVMSAALDMNSDIGTDSDSEDDNGEEPTTIRIKYLKTKNKDKKKSEIGHAPGIGSVAESANDPTITGAYCAPMSNGIPRKFIPGELVGILLRRSEPDKRLTKPVICEEIEVHEIPEHLGEFILEARPVVHKPNVLFSENLRPEYKYRKWRKNTES